MFTPQRKPWQMGSPVPRTEAKAAGSGSRSMDKGKAVAFVDGPLPPLASLSRNWGQKAEDGIDTEDTEVWRKFREAGLLDEAEMERKDLEALVEKVSKLQHELFDYQHTMGLLLIEKKEWTSKYEELRQDLAEYEEILKREQSANLVALSEAEQREENIRKVLETEKRRVADLQRTLREVNEEKAQIKIESERKLADANVLKVGLQERSLKVEERLNAAEGKIADVNRKGTELDMRLSEAKARENMLQMEHISFVEEQEAQKNKLHRQREDLRLWEQKLQKGEQSHHERLKILNEREQTANECDRINMQKELELKVKQKNIDSAHLLLKEKELDINRRLSDIEVQEKGADSLRSILEVKQRELLLSEGKLNDREKVEIQHLLDNQRAILEDKMAELGLEHEEKRAILEKEICGRVDALKQRENGISQQAEKLVKQEQLSDEKLTGVDEKEKDVEMKWESLKKKEKVLKANEENFEVKRQQMLADRGHIQFLINEIEKTRAENNEKGLKIIEESDQLQVIREERAEHIQMLSMAKQEIEECKSQKELLLRKRDDLKQEKDNLDKEWRVLVEKRAQVYDKLQELSVEREKVEKLKFSGDERLKEEGLSRQLQWELEDLTLQKESFALTMEHKDQILSEQAENERNLMLQDSELWRRDLHMCYKRKQEEMEKKFRERERVFEEEMQREQNDIKKLIEDAQQEMLKINSGKQEIEKEKEMVALKKKQITAYQLQISEDDNNLIMLRKALKNERAWLIQENGRVLTCIEKYKSCENCSENIKRFTLSDFELPRVEAQASHLGIFEDSLLESPLEQKDSRGSSSWLQKCVPKVFNLSPNRKQGQVVSPVSVELSTVRAKAEAHAEGPRLFDHEGVTGRDQKLSSGSCYETCSDQRFLSDKVTTEMGETCALSIDDNGRPIMANRVQEAPENSRQSELNMDRKKHGRKRISGLRRTRTMEATAEEAEAFLRETAERSGQDMHTEANTTDTMNEEGRGDSHFSGTQLSNTVRKRQHAETFKATECERTSCDSEGHSNSVKAGSRKKRRQISAPALQTPGEKRYNLRSRKFVDEASADKMTTKSAAIEDNNAGVVKSEATPELEEEVNGTRGYGYEDEDRGAILDDEDEYDQLEHPGQASIGKKIWTFFTT